MTHPNEDLVREAFAAFGRGDIGASGHPLALPRPRPLAGDHEGVAQVARMIGQPAELSGGTHSIEVHDVIGNDDHVVVLATARAERPGRKLESSVVHTFHVCDGKVTEAWTHHADLYSHDEFWS